MTDRERFEELFDSVGLGYRLTNSLLVLEAKMGGVKGYTGFEAEFEFDNQGNFVSAGIWE